MDPLQARLLAQLDALLHRGAWLLSAANRADVAAAGGFVASLTADELARLKSFYVAPQSREEP